MRRLSAVLVLAAVACGAGASAPAPDSGIEGLVMLGPTCPVVQEGQDCEDEPYAGEVRIVDPSNDELVTTVRSGPDGRFEVALPPGTYRLEPVAPSAHGLPYGKPVDVVVRPHAYARVTVTFDTGIR